ncbi:lysine-specific demethylase 8-like [Panonychus citri]|uniref:lysine-specific demethylase 8-like n=1 Tax=Panonychus citri TaxID=50023 RepID=UPI002307DC27|nr:lysine-specific demethylase 8-like [Panonychus citri]
MTTVRDIVNNINILLTERNHLAVDDLKLIQQSTIGTYFYTQFRLVLNLIGLPRVNQQQQQQQNDHQIGSTIHHHRHVMKITKSTIGNVRKQSADYLEYLETCEMLIDFSWEKLNIGHWKSVKLDYRYLYGYVCIIKTLLQLRIILNSPDANDQEEEEEDEDDDNLNPYQFNFKLDDKPKVESNCLPKGLNEIILESLIQTCDMACIMCPPIMDGLASDIACLLHSILSVHYSTKWKTLSTIMKGREKILPYQSIDPVNRIEIIHCPSLEIFKQSYANKSKPCIITGAMDDWSACDNQSDNHWSLDYLLSNMGARTVPVEIGNKYTDFEWSQKLMTVECFIDKHWTDGPSKGYIAQQELFQQFKQLSYDFTIPDYCGIKSDQCKDDHQQTKSDTNEKDKDKDKDSNDNESDDQYDRNNIVVNGWFGPWGTVSPLHHDPYDNLLAQVMGGKYIRLYSNSINPNLLYPHSDYLLSNTSQVDIESIDPIRFPMFNSLPYLECYLDKGQMLFIPKGYWHFVKSMSISFSINFWWT